MKSQEKFRVVFAGGGSGGHVYPTLAVIEQLNKSSSEMKFALEMVRMGPRDGYETLFANEGVSISPIMAGKIRRYFSLSNIIDIPKFIIGFVQALFKLYFIMPDVIFSKGGSGALPVVIAGWFYRIPIAIHESDAKPGGNNLMSRHFAKKIFVSFETAGKYFDARKVEATGTPVRDELFTQKTTKALARETLGFSASVPLVLILGGSQGSQRINLFIMENLSEIMKMTQALHQTGVANFAEVQKLSRAALIDGAFKNRYEPVAYLDEKNMNLALIAADVAVVRAGSSTITELAAYGVPALLIPLTIDNGQQRLNAEEFAKAGAGVVIEEVNLLPGIFLAQLKAILADDALRQKMSAASSQFFIPNAAEKIAQGIMLLGAGQ